jgi:transaldolase/glucose-6-phosphate isomerase
MGLAARHGRDKLTLVLSERLAHLGAWIEQLVAESTGKNGKAIIPVDREPLGEPSSYGDDRFFVHVRSRESKGGVTESEAEQKIEALAAAGHPIVSIDVSDVLDLGQEFFRWEIATAVAGAVIGVNPFDQPDVEASKIATRKLTSEYEKTGRFPEESSFFEERDVRLFSDDANASALRSSARDPSLVGLLGAHLDRLRPGDYFAVLAYVKRSEEHESILRSLCLDVRDKKGVAACLGFGPRFLHSTGQAYKGGPKSGVFLQVTSDDAEDIDVPGKDYSFGAVKTAQSLGDFQVLIDRERRALRAHVSADVIAGLTEIRNAVAVALA